VINTARKGIGARHPEQIQELKGDQALVPLYRGQVGWVPLSQLIPVEPSYNDLLGHRLLNAAEVIKERMKQGGETFDQAVRRMTRMRGTSPEKLAILREYVLSPDPKKLRR